MISPQPTGPTMFAYHPLLGSIPVPGQTGMRALPNSYKYRYRNDARGLRAVAQGTQVKDDSLVLLLGDSFTYGVGVDDDQTFASRLQANVSGAGLAIRIVNAGNPGKGTDYAVRFLDLYGRTFRPRLIMLGFFPNDFSDNSRGDYYALDGDGSLHPKDWSSSFYARKDRLGKSAIYNWIMSRSQAANLVRLWFVQSILSEKSRDGGSASDEVTREVDAAYVTPESIKATEIFIRGLAIRAEELESKLVLVYIPSSSEVERFRLSRTISPDEVAFVRIARGRGAPLLSLTRVLADQPYTVDTLYYREGHWTSLSHSIAAARLASVVRALLVPR